MNCTQCHKRFNAGTNCPKILPCLAVKCLACLKKMPNIQNEYLIDCKVCSKPHIISDLTTLTTSDIALHLVEKPKKQDITTSVLEFAENMPQLIRGESYEVYKHYDNIICDIDIKGETLVQLVHSCRQQLQNRVKEYRDQTLAFFNSDNGSRDEISAIKDKFIDYSQKNALINENDCADVITSANKLQLHLSELKKNLWYFSESNVKFENSFLGHNLNAAFDQIYHKIRNLDINTAEKVVLSIQFNDLSLRQEIFLLGDKIVKMFFTTNQSIHFESYDLKGKRLKTLLTCKGISSFPVSHSYGANFVVTFSGAHSHWVHLYDSELNLLQCMEKSKSIECVFMDASNIVLLYGNNAGECCQVYNYAFNHLHSFGQQLDSGAPFFMEKSVFSKYEVKKFYQRVNTKIFGYTSKYIYLYNYNKVIVMDRQTGHIAKQFPTVSTRPYYMLDAQGNVIQVDTLEKKLTVFNAEFEFLCENVYNDEFEHVSVTKDNVLVFNETEKAYLVFV